MTTCARRSGATSSILPPVTAKALTMRPGSIRMDGVEVLRSNYYIYFENVWMKFHHLRSTTLKDCDSAKEAINQAHAFALDQGTFDQKVFYERLVSLTTRASRKALSARILLSASLLSWIEGWESAACWLWRTPWSRNWTGCGLSMCIRMQAEGLMEKE